jgi:DNA-binding transcriptional LysR family regulator
LQAFLQHRTTRRLSISEVVERFLEHSRQTMVLAEEAVDELRYWR